MKGELKPVLTGPSVVRAKDQVLLFDNFAVVDTSAHYSDEIEVAPYRHAAVNLWIDSTLAPTTLHVEVEFLDRWTGKWHTLKEGPWAALYYEDTDTASGIGECLTLPVAGRRMRLKLTGAGCTSSAYFTVSASLDLQD